jgi:hypothetical protein
MVLHGSADGESGPVSAFWASSAKHGITWFSLRWLTELHHRPLHSAPVAARCHKKDNKTFPVHVAMAASCQNSLGSRQILVHGVERLDTVGGTGGL